MKDFPLEDNAYDLVTKLLRAQGRRLPSLALDLELPVETVEAALQAGGPEAPLLAIARSLGLHPPALRDLREETYRPQVPAVAGLFAFTSTDPGPPLPGEHANAYLVADPATRQAALFDAGVSPDLVLPVLEARALTLSDLYLTHTHYDHVEFVAAYLAACPQARLWVGAPEEHLGARPMAPGTRRPLGQLTIEARATPGHSAGGLSYVVHGLEQPVALVGDALFAGSLGKMTPEAFSGGVAAIRREILALPPATVLCPGHGPQTTVALELDHHPLFAQQG